MIFALKKPDICIKYAYPKSSIVNEFTTRETKFSFLASFYGFKPEMGFSLRVAPENYIVYRVIHFHLDFFGFFFMTFYRWKR